MEIPKKIKKIYNDFKLKFKLLIPIISVLFIALFVFTIYLINDQKQKSEKNLIQKSKNVSLILQNVLTEAVWAYDEKALKSNCDTALKIPEVTKVRVKLSNEKTIFNSKKKIKCNGDILIQKNLIKGNEIIGTMEMIFTNFYIVENIFQIALKLILLSIIIFSIII